MAMQLPAGKEREALAAAGRLVPSVIVPAPPSTNNLFVDVTIAGKLRRVPSGQYKAWRGLVMAAMRTLTSPAAYPVAVRFDLLGKWNRQRDIDNVAKGLLDSLVENEVLAGDNLACISGLRIWHMGGPGEPRVKISFEDVTPSLFGV